MGIIKDDVFTVHLGQYPQERAILDLFVQGFDINWGRRRRAYNTEVSLYFIKPEQYIADLFGFDYELALILADFDTLEPRTIQAVEALLSDDPAKGRVDQTVYFLATKDVSGEEFVSNYTSVNPQSRIPVVFTYSESSNWKHDQWFLRNKIIRQLHSRDLFDYKLPLDNDLYFFGRDTIISEHLDAIKKSQNMGIFGLRKTGKTSIIYKIRRIIERESLGTVLYYDLKDPSLRMQRWNELLASICKDINSYLGRKREIPTDPKHISKEFKTTVESIPSNKKVVLVFDEIEYITPLSPLDRHWQEDFIPFWQTLWSVQSQIRRFTNIVAGVNPSIAEQALINDVQNPMFGIIQSKYLRGFALDELRGMVRFFGKRMGLRFDHTATEYLHKRYGGHPLLTRLACSNIHNSLNESHEKRPFTITSAYLQATEESRDSELTFYCQHVVSELQKFYLQEYEMLEILSSGHTVDFMELQNEQEYTHHLREYGLITTRDNGKPEFAIPVIGRYIAIDYARREGRLLKRKIIAPKERTKWLSRRKSAIIKDIDFLQDQLTQNKRNRLFGIVSFPEADKFHQIEVVDGQSGFRDFINTCNRCFVESIENYGKHFKIKDIFWNDIKNNHPYLWSALHRIKLYRHNDVHLELNQNVNEQFRILLSQDFEGKRPSLVDEPWFMLQQITLDELFAALQYEINKIT